MSFYNAVECVYSQAMDASLWKIKDDDAFFDIIEGWYLQGRTAFTSHLKGTDVVIQAGGYCGVFPRLFSSIFKTVYTFEPDPLNFHCLVANNPFENVIKIQGALGEIHEMVSMVHRCPTNRGMHVVEAKASSTIPTFAIDDLELPACDLIQLDLEGYEIKALVGATWTIDQFKPVISVEDTNPDIEKFLSQWNYKAVATAFRDTVYAVD